VKWVIQTIDCNKMFRKINDAIFPAIGPDERVRVKRSLSFILPIVVVVSFVFWIFFALNNPDDERKWLILAGCLLSLPSWWLAYKNYLRFSALSFVVLMWALMSIGVLYSGGIISVGHGGFLLLIFMTGLLLGGRYAFLVLLLSVLSTAWLAAIETYVGLPETLPTKPHTMWFVFTFYLVVGWILLALTMRHLRAALSQASLELDERVRTEKALRESQDRLDLALSSANMGILDWNLESNRIEWLGRAYEIWDITDPSLIKDLDGVLRLVHPDDLDLVKQAIKNCLEGISSYFQVEHRIFLKSGEIAWISAQGQVYCDEKDRPARIIGTLTDITLNKQSEQAILDANTRLSTYTDTLEERSGLLLLGADVARAATAILDPRELSQQVVELVQKQFDLYYVGLFLIEDDLRWAILRAGTGHAGKKMLEDGHRLEVGGTSMIGWCIVNCKARIALDVGDDAVHFINPLLPETRSELALPLVSRGEVLGALTIQSDKPTSFTQENMVSFETMADLLANAILNARLYDQLQRELEERKRVEDKVRRLNVELESRVTRRTAALRASEEKFRALAENNPLQIARYDRDGRYLYLNHLGSHSKFRTERVMGKTLREVFGDHPTIDFAEEQILRVFDSGQPLKTEYELNDFVGLWSIAPEFDPQGEVVSVISTTLDITERKRTEEELQQRSAELQAANRELEAFSYSVSHDLRAPLRAIDGFTRILMDDFANQLPEDGLMFLQRTRHAAQNMGQLIDDLLRLSRITRTELNCQEIDLSVMAREILEQLQIAEPGRKVKVVLAHDLKSSGDERLVRVALENLLNNAWKFTTKNQRAKIRVGKLKRKGKDAFFVRDNGVGFNMDYVDKLFGPFQRLHTVNEFPGTGIGLAIVKRIIHKHGGEIWPESEPGKGATFYFTLE
jgi:PAS domain S-box-containing protein